MNRRQYSYNSDSDSSEDEGKYQVCTYRKDIQYYNFIGGFTSYDVNDITKCVWWFTELNPNIQITCDGNNIYLINSSQCGQEKVVFQYGAIVFQPKLFLHLYDSKCKTEIEFNENLYQLKLNAFEVYDLVVGTVLLVENGKLQVDVYCLLYPTRHSKVQRKLNSILKHKLCSSNKDDRDLTLKLTGMSFVSPGLDVNVPIDFSLPSINMNNKDDRDLTLKLTPGSIIQPVLDVNVPMNFSLPSINMNNKDDRDLTLKLTPGSIIQPVLDVNVPMNFSLPSINMNK